MLFVPDDCLDRGRALFDVVYVLLGKPEGDEVDFFRVLLALLFPGEDFFGKLEAARGSVLGGLLGGTFVLAISCSCNLLISILIFDKAASESAALFI